MMYVKKIKRKCGVRGCKNTETYAISKSREMGNSIIACKECLEEALDKIKEQYEPTFTKAEPIPPQKPEESTEDENNAPTIEEEPIEEAEKKPKRQRKAK